MKESPSHGEAVEQKSEQPRAITVSLEALVGKHVLSGVSTGSDGDANAISFVLDGTAYTATEDPDDGYRSCMRDIRVGGEVANLFPPAEVVGTIDDEILTFRDTATGKDVLRVGTDHSDSYYSWFVSEFTPENMAVNARTT